MQRHPMFGIFLALFGALVLTPDTLLMRWSDMDGFQMLGWRGSLMGCVLLAYWAVMRGGSRRADLQAFASGAGLTIVVCQFFNATLFSFGIATAPVSVVLFGVATVPVFAAIFARLVIGEATHPSTWLTIAVVLAGIGVAVFGGNHGAGAPALRLDTLWGALAGLSVAASLALNFVVIRARPTVPILLSIGCGALLAGMMGVVLTGPGVMTDGGVLAIAVTGLVILPVSFMTLSLASRFTHASNVSLLLLLETILGPLWVWMGTDESPTPAMVLGGAVVVAALAIYLIYTDRRQARARRRAAAA
ncbi:DMT family transporter [Sediminimonas qiaohouensis]|uniref:DMT family transporter n=1 Tax=Sediminimonas qiaohouensis TaxID=552061 RepID=UPI0004153261|nr:DMT family transporter [Sediminimonas qiaohouensis]